ncbi:hypothetical protein WDW86_09670 [Bdellovibrionota bacterium FG-2]
MSIRDTHETGASLTNETFPTSWLPLMDYAIKTGVSLSTLRRQIKANKIPFRLDEGRYMIFSDGLETAPVPSRPVEPEASLEIIKLRHELNSAHEEIAELKTLIAFYEESPGSQKQSHDA